ncbi:MAG: site-2 protease family protein [bacterium]
MHTLQTILLVAPILLFSVIAHEIAHGYAALKQGDRTALDAGRLSWNPLKHIDPFLTILLPLIMLTGSSMVGRPVVFGGAKPVPVDPRNYKHVRRGDIIVSLAGVATNLLIGLVCPLLIVILGKLGGLAPVLDQTIGIVQAMLTWGIILNFSLIAFNLLPIPPLDGSHVMKYLLPRPLAVRYVQFARYGLLVLMLLLFVGDRVLNVWFTPASIAIDALVNFANPSIVPAAAQWLR